MTSLTVEEALLLRPDLGREAFVRILKDRHVSFEFDGENKLIVKTRTTEIHFIVPSPEKFPSWKWGAPQPDII